MKDTSKMSQSLIQEFTENYTEKLFYFCLKKTGNSFEAEDLTQNIALNIISALNSGTLPVNFPAWVWRIARNKYSVWVDEKRRRTYMVSGDHIGDCEIEDESANTLAEVIQGEQLALLRRELAFISSDYRNIITAYYFENRSIRDIAASLSLSETAVKQRLYRARKILKEGISMAREFGVKSYKPEEIRFVNCCTAFGARGQPWYILNHALYKNIFLEAYGNPSTAEELALELGIALPYMEDELEFLKSETFLNKNGNKYETSFPIISKHAQKKVYDYNKQITEEVTHLFENLIDEFSKACDNHGFNYYGNYQSYEDAKWTLLMKAFDWLIYEDDNERDFEYTKRPYNGAWDIVGYEMADIPQTHFIGLHCCTGFWFQQFKFNYNAISEKTPDFIDDIEASALLSVAQDNYKDCEDQYIQKLCDYGYIRKTESGYEPAIVVFDHKDTDNYSSEFSDMENKMISEIATELRRIIADAKEASRKITTEDLPLSLKNDEHLCSFACAQNRLNREAVFAQALQDGWIKHDENTSPVVGACLYI